MAKYKISGVWKDTNGTITHYALHTVNESSTTRGIKISKAEALRLLSIIGNSAITWMWNYKTSFWKDGEKVEVVSGSYLRSYPDGIVSDNLAHLINYGSLQ